MWVELIWKLGFVYIFSPLSSICYDWVEWIRKMSEGRVVDVENERAEWMWTISEDDKVLLTLAKISSNTLFCVFVLY